MLSFKVYGEPITQGSKKAFVNKKTMRAIIVDDTGVNLKNWKRQIQVAAGQAMGGKPLLEGPVLVSIRFMLMKPKTLPKDRRHGWPTTRPDLDKLLRASWDAMTGVVYRDDSQIVMTRLLKVYGDPPCAEIMVDSIISRYDGTFLDTPMLVGVNSAVSKEKCD